MRRKSLICKDFSAILRFDEKTVFNTSQRKVDTAWSAIEETGLLSPAGNSPRLWLLRRINHISIRFKKKNYVLAQWKRKIGTFGIRGN